MNPKLWFVPTFVLIVAAGSPVVFGQLGLPNLKANPMQKNTAVAAVPWPAGLVVPKPDEEGYATMKRYSAPVLGKVCYMVDRVDSLETEKNKLAAESTSFLFDLRATAQEREELKKLDDELSKESNPSERDRRTAARLKFIQDTAVAPTAELKLDEQQKTLLSKQAKNAAIAKGVVEQQNLSIGYGLTLAGSEIKNAPNQIKDPLKAKVVIDDTKKLQKKLDANKKVNEESKVAIDHLNKAMSELCKAQNVETPSQEAVDSGVKAAATQKLTVSDE